MFNWKSIAPLLVLLGLSIALMTLGPLLSEFSPTQFNFKNRLLDPSWNHLLGTDQMGRDVLSRLISGARYSLGVAMFISLLAACIGTLVGLMAGTLGGKMDHALMKLTEIFLAFPELIAAVVIAGILGPSLFNMIIALVSVSWMRYARLVRGICLSVNQRDYVRQSRLFGIRLPTLIVRHFLPPVLPSLLVLWTVGWSRSILAISGLGFLGFGLQPPDPEWGAMLLDGKTYLFTHPQLMIFPGGMVLIFVLAINLVGDQLRDRFG